MLTDLVQIKRLGESQREENSKFRAWLKRHNFVERRFKLIAQNTEEAIDCTACANCCRVATTQVNERDTERLARFFRLTVPAFLKQYTDSTDEGVILKRNENGCVFLDGNMCSVYDHRPGTCELFPHLAKGNGSLLSRMWHMADRAVYCPIVFNTLERFKAETGFKR
jgi:Fe-S-cluster containining protein